MSKTTFVETLSRTHLNDDVNSKINVIMVVDIFNTLNIAKFFNQPNQKKYNIHVLENLYVSSKKNSNCKNVNCASLNELVMLKELNRDDSVFDKVHMGIIQEKTMIVDNGHITNLLFMRLSNKKMYKIYMREFKKRKHNVNYVVFFIKNARPPRNEFETKLLKELNSVLKQIQIEINIFDKNSYKSPTLLKKEIRSKILYYFNTVNKTVTHR